MKSLLHSLEVPVLSEKRLRMRWCLCSRKKLSPILCTERGFVRHKGFGRSKVHRALRKTQTQEWLGALAEGRRVSEDWKQTADAQLHWKSPSPFAQGDGWCRGTQGPLAQPNTPGWAFLNKRHC